MVTNKKPTCLVFCSVAEDAEHPFHVLFQSKYVESMLDSNLLLQVSSSLELESRFSMTGIVLPRPV